MFANFTFATVQGSEDVLEKVGVSKLEVMVSDEGWQSALTLVAPAWKLPV